MIWRSIAVACQLGRAVAPNWRSWSAWMGYALRRGGRLSDATAAYVAAITGRRAAKDWVDVITNVGEGGIASSSPAQWHYGLGRCLIDRGNFEAAETLIRTACRHRPHNIRWLDTLARVETQTGDLQAAVSTQRRVVELHGRADPGARFKLAVSLDKAGLWSDAADILADNLSEHPNHASSYKLLGAVATSLSMWGGSFVDTLPERLKCMFSLSVLSPARSNGLLHSSTPADLAVNALQHAVDLEPSRTTWQGALADALVAAGAFEAAIEMYEAALVDADASNDRWALNAKQRWQFQCERCYHLLGQGRVEDPLFDATVESVGKTAIDTLSVAGLFTAELNYLGLTINGLLGSANCEHVNIYFNGKPLRAVNVARESFLPQFKLTIKRNTLALFPNTGVLEVRTPDGEQLNGPRGADHIVISIPHGDGRLLGIIGDGATLNKKGEIRPSPEETRHREDRDLEIYSRLRTFFEDHLGRPLFLLYGTLLGYHRGSDLIPGDDDFDAGYISDKSDPLAVKEEAKEIIFELVRAGFTVSINRRGRMFRVQLQRTEPAGCHVDVHPTWFQDGNVWIHNVVAMPSSREDFLPVVNGTLRGVTVSVPRRPEIFLRGNYGTGWKVPDPGFRYYPTEVDPAIMRNLAKALITVGEYRSLAERVQRELGHTPTAGRLVSIGSQDLYPLSGFIM